MGPTGYRMRGTDLRWRWLYGKPRLAALDLRGVVPDERSSTVGDIRRRLLARDRSLVAPFNDVASAFVVSAYAERPIEASQWEKARAAYAALTSGTAT